MMFSWISFITASSICCILIRVSVTAPSNVPAPLKKIFNAIVKKLPEKLDTAELLEPPHLKFTAIPEDEIVSEGSKVTFLCEAEGIPPPTLRWTLNGKAVKQGPHQADNNLVEKLMNVGMKTIEQGITASKLSIDCASAASVGVYKCIADNGHKTIQSEARLHVRKGNALRSCTKRRKSEEDGRSPVIYMWTDGRLEVEGANVQLFCRANGQPAPRIQWLNGDGQPLTSSLLGSFVQLPNGDLLITKADYDSLDAYTCVARNIYGKDKVEAFFYPTEPETEEAEADKEEIEIRPLGDILL